MSKHTTALFVPSTQEGRYALGDPHWPLGMTKLFSRELRFFLPSGERSHGRELIRGRSPMRPHASLWKWDEGCGSFEIVPKTVAHLPPNRLARKEMGWYIRQGVGTISFSMPGDGMIYQTRGRTICWSPGGTSPGANPEQTPCLGTRELCEEREPFPACQRLWEQHRREERSCHN